MAFQLLDSVLCKIPKQVADGCDSVSQISGRFFYCRKNI